MMENSQDRLRWLLEFAQDYDLRPESADQLKEWQKLKLADEIRAFIDASEKEKISFSAKTAEIIAYERDREGRRRAMDRYPDMPGEIPLSEADIDIFTMDELQSDIRVLLAMMTPNKGGPAGMRGVFPSSNKKNR